MLCLVALLRCQGLKPDGFTVTSEISAVAWLLALQLLRSFPGGLEVDVVAATATVTALGHGLRWRQAAALSGARTPVAMNAALAAQQRADRWQSAVELLRCMARGSVRPTLETRAALMQGCTFVGQWLAKGIQRLSQKDSKGLLKVSRGGPCLCTSSAFSAPAVPRRAGTA